MFIIPHTINCTALMLNILRIWKMKERNPQSYCIFYAQFINAIQFTHLFTTCHSPLVFIFQYDVSCKYFDENQSTNHLTLDSGHHQQPARNLIKILHYKTKNKKKKKNAKKKKKKIVEKMHFFLIFLKFYLFFNFNCCHT